MRLFRLPLRLHQNPDDNDCLVLTLHKTQVAGMIKGLTDLLSQPVPAGAEDAKLRVYGSLQEHFEEWRPLSVASETQCQDSPDPEDE